MKKIDLKNITKLCLFNLSTTKKTIIGWSIAIFSVMTLYMILFPSINEMANLKFEAMPQELLQFVGMTEISDLSDFTAYYSMIFTLVLVAISIFSATFSAGLITKEEKSKSIEFLSSLSVSRNEIYIAKYFTSLIATACIILCAVVSTIACGLINGGETFSLMNIIGSAKITGFSPIFFGGISLAIAGFSSKIGTGSVASGIVLFSYLLGYLGQLVGENGQALLYFSPFISFTVENALKLSSQTIATVAVYMAIYLTSIVVGGFFYKQRDLRI